MPAARRNQAAVRKLVKDNDFLRRDYSREKNYNKLTSERVETAESELLAANDNRVSRTISKSTRRNVSTAEQKQAALDSYRSFKRDGAVLSNHAVEQYQNRQRHEKTGRVILNYDQVLDAIKSPANYFDDGREIHFHNGIVAVTEKDAFNTVVTIYHTHKPKKRWKKID